MKSSEKEDLEKLLKDCDGMDEPKRFQIKTEIEQEVKNEIKAIVDILKIGFRKRLFLK